MFVLKNQKLVDSLLHRSIITLNDARQYQGHCAAPHLGRTREYFNLHPELALIPNTLRHLSTFKGPYCFICICGDYRSGKSFLLNSLFFDFQGFQTSGSTQACTKGINIWSQPIQKEGLTVWVLDTEGFGSMDKDSNYDGKIFLLSLLMSNILLYNSFGAIDDNSITKLGLVCSQAHLINPNFADARLFWILRDFSLEMVDRQGRTLSADEYLQDCLRDGQSHHNRAQKQLLKRLFKSRHCVPLIRPVIDEQTLSNLKGISKQEIRPQFKSQISTLSTELSTIFQAKEIAGVNLDDTNIQIILNQFVGVLNSGNIDFELTCSYDKIKQYQHEKEKEKIIDLIYSKISKVRALLPVKQEHLNYLQQEVIEVIEEQVENVWESGMKEYCKMLVEVLKAVAEKQISGIQVLNKGEVQNQIKDYLYRQMIELYPSIITLTPHHFENKFEEYISKLKKECSDKYQLYFRQQKQLQSMYCVFLQKETRKIFYELVKRWRSGLKDLQQKLQEAKRFRTMTDEELTKLKEEKRKVHKTLEDFRREEGRSLSKIKIQMQETYKQELMAVVTEYEIRLRSTEDIKDKELKQLKLAIEAFEKQKIQLTTSIQYEKQSLLQQVALEKQKTELLEIKYEQLKNSSELQMEQARSSFENKLKITEIKYNQTANTLNSQRRKFQILNEERRMEEGQIMDELSDKNERIQKLTSELMQLQQKYKTEMENILNEQKDILVKTISNKIQEYEHKCKLYQNQLQQSHTVIQQLRFYEQKCDDLQLSTRQLKRKQEEEADKIDLLNNKIKKYQNQIAEKERTISSLKLSFEQEIALAKETIANNTNFIKQTQNRHREEIQYHERKIENEVADASQAMARTHEANLRQNKAMLEQKFGKERVQLKEIISNNYEQIERLKLKVTTLCSEIEKIFGILSKIKGRHQNQGHSNRITPAKSSGGFSSFNPFANADELLQISESPEEESLHGQMSDKKEKIENIRFIAEEIQEIYQSMHQEIQLLEVERSELKTSLDQHVEELQHFQVLTSKAKGENRDYLTQVETLRNKAKLLATITEDYRQIQARLQNLQKQNFQLKKDSDLKGQSFSSRQTHYKESVALHKETITNLTEQNKRMGTQIRTLTDTISELESELERFKLWAEVQSKSEYNGTNRQNQKGEDNSKIKDLEMELKRQISRVQEQKLAEIQKYSKQENRLSSLMAEHRLDELSQLRKQNELLYQQLKECHEKELRLMSQSKMYKQQQNQYEENRYQSLAQELEVSKQNARHIVNRLQAELESYIEQKRQLKRQFDDLQGNLQKKYELTIKMMQQQIVILKKDKQVLNEIYSKKIAILQESLNSKVSQSQRKIAELQLRSEEERDGWEKEMQRVGLEGERHRMKYEQLLKVNNELVKESEELKSKAHQQTLKEKYKQKIGRLFND